MKRILSVVILGVVILMGMSVSANAVSKYGPEEYNGQEIKIYKLNPQEYHGQEILPNKVFGPEEYHGQKLYDFNSNK